VAHLSEGTLRRKVDDETAFSEADARHYSACADCQARYAAVADDAKAVAGVLAAPDLKVDVASALNRVRSTPAAQPRFGIRLPIARPASRPMAVFAAAAVMVALVVTAFAAENIFFQPKSLQPVPVSVADLQSLSGLSDYGTFAWTTQPAPQLVTSADQAATVSGLTVPVVTLPKDVSTTVSYAAMPQAVGTFTFDAAKASAAAVKAGKTMPAMPAGMDGSKLTVTVGPAIVAIYGNLNLGAPTGTTTGATTDIPKVGLPQLIIGKATAPVVTSSGVTTQTLVNFLLAQPGVSQQLADAIRAIKDPSTTLPIPIPVQYATSKTQPVQGVDGLALGDNTGIGAALIWIKDGTVYGVAGTLQQQQVLDVASSLH
jgi:hypothetical protein